MFISGRPAPRTAVTFSWTYIITIQIKFEKYLSDEDINRKKIIIASDYNYNIQGIGTSHTKSMTLKNSTKFLLYENNIGWTDNLGNYGEMKCVVSLLIYSFVFLLNCFVLYLILFDTTRYDSIRYDSIRFDVVW